jgi:hypothetical protein
MEPIDCIASLHRITKDREGEVTLTLKVPKSHAARLFVIPEETALHIYIEENPS